MRDLFGAGVFHPNSLTYSSGAWDADFRAGRFAVEVIAWGGYLLQWSGLAGSNPSARMRPMQPFAHDGGQPQYHAGPGHYGVTFLKKSSPQRLKLLLRILNVLAAPFGTEEWLLNLYGLKDVDYKFAANGAPAPTPQGRAETSVPLRYIASPPAVLFDPANSRDFATVGHVAEKTIPGAARCWVGHDARARPFLEESIEMLRAAGDLIAGAEVLEILANVALWEGHVDDARSCAIESLEGSAGLGALRIMARHWTSSCAWAQHEATTSSPSEWPEQCR